MSIQDNLNAAIVKFKKAPGADLLTNDDAVVAGIGTIKINCNIS